MAASAVLEQGFRMMEKSPLAPVKSRFQSA